MYTTQIKGDHPVAKLPQSHFLTAEVERKKSDEKLSKVRRWNSKDRKARKEKTLSFPPKGGHNKSSPLHPTAMKELSQVLKDRSSPNLSISVDQMLSVASCSSPRNKFSFNASPRYKRTSPAPSASPRPPPRNSPSHPKPSQPTNNLANSSKLFKGFDSFECYIETRNDSNQEYQRFWSVIRFPHIKFYLGEERINAHDTFSITSVATIIHSTNLEFIIETVIGNSIICKCDTEEECNKYLAFLIKETKIPLTKSEKEKGLSLHDSHSDFSLKKSCYYKTDCTSDSNAFGSLFSTKMAFHEEDGVLTLTAGTLDDIIKWCIIHSTTPQLRNWDAACLFLSYYWICDLNTFVDKIRAIWKEWKEGGFPTNFPRKLLSQRLQYFMFHFIESPVMGEHSKTAEIRENLKKKLRFSSTALAFLDTAIFPCQYIHTLEEVTLDYESELECAIDFSVELLANQITLDDVELYKKIGIHEFMDANWEKKETGPDVCNLVERYNKISQWVSFSILDADDATKQLETYKKLIKVAQKLHELQNYNGCTAILGGLSDASVGRLKNISNNLSEKKSRQVDALKDIYSPLNGYRLYRALPLTPACIPSLAVYLRDLTLSLDGNLVYLDEETCEIINFERMTMIGKRVLELYHINTSYYTSYLSGNATLKSYLAEIDPPNSDQLYELSLQIEPPRGKGAEDELNNLKSENEKLKAEISLMRHEGKQRGLQQQQILEQIQNSNTKASSTVRALLEATTEGTSSSSEQLILLKLQLQAALDLAISQKK